MGSWNAFCSWTIQQYEILSGSDSALPWYAYTSLGVHIPFQRSISPPLGCYCYICFRYRLIPPGLLSLAPHCHYHNRTGRKIIPPRCGALNLPMRVASPQITNSRCSYASQWCNPSSPDYQIYVDVWLRGAILVSEPSDYSSFLPHFSVDMELKVARQYAQRLRLLVIRGETLYSFLSLTDLGRCFHCQ